MTTTRDHDLAPEPGAGSGDPGGSGQPGGGDPTGEGERLAALERTVEGQRSRRDGWMILLFVFAAVALMTSIVGVGFGARAIDESKHNVDLAATGGSGAGGGGAAAATTPAVAMVHLSEFKIEQPSVTIAAGGTLQVMNTGSMEHNLAVKGTALASPMIKAGGTADLPLGDLAPGTYTMFCQVPGHEAAGMTATLHVEAGSAAAATAATTPTTEPARMSVAQMDEQMLKTTKEFPAKTAGLGAQPLAPTVLADGTKQFELTTKIVKWEVSPGKTVDAWTYNGTVPGPTLRVNPGDKVKVVLHNELPESTVIHFHGIDTPNAMDGVPGITQDPVRPGQSFTYSFTAQSTPAVGMYHSHHDAVSQVPDGLAGAFLIGDEPLPAGVSVTQQHIMMLNDAGTIGLALNGKSFPATAPISAKAGEWVEVQYMNEGQMIHPMHLHGIPQMVIAKDGFPLATPSLEDTVTVAPGERYTVLVHATAPGVWAWHCHILSHAEDSTGMLGMVTALIVK